MSSDALVTYSPLNTLKPIAEHLWIVDGPAIRFGIAGLKVPFPTRMTVVRLAGGDLFIHSPTALTPELQAAVGQLGSPRWIVGPNRIHYWWIPDWHAAFPAASVYLAPRAREQAGAHIAFECLPLERVDGYPWDTELATLPVVGGYMTEVEFFHRASRTLVLTDLIENFEPAKVGSGLMRWLMRVGGVLDPDGRMPRDMRMTFAKHKRQLRAAVEQMIAWDPERIILAHGRWYEGHGAAELRRAFDWVLD
ncbi:MAG: DUF4336 domain-containing protein [Burkholderiales bacterium]|nr:DUF4336 domain-containing protein [Burkholderiales bacterium]MDE2608188.1 DUF4336 domain-containing protein [Burkholderiales bacterium]